MSRGEEAAETQGDSVQAWAAHTYAIMKSLKKQDCFRLLETTNGPVLLTDRHGAEEMEHHLSISVRPSNLSQLTSQGNYTFVVDMDSCSSTELKPLVIALGNREQVNKFLDGIPEIPQESQVSQEPATKQR